MLMVTAVITPLLLLYKSRPVSGLMVPRTFPLRLVPCSRKELPGQARYLAEVGPGRRAQPESRGGLEMFCLRE